MYGFKLRTLKTSDNLLMILSLPTSRNRLLAPAVAPLLLFERGENLL